MEWLFSQIKRQYKKKISRLSIMRDYTAADARALVRIILEEMPLEHKVNTLRANRAYINRYKVTYV